MTKKASPNMMMNNINDCGATVTNLTSLAIASHRPLRHIRMTFPKAECKMRSGRERKQKQNKKNEIDESPTSLASPKPITFLSEAIIMWGTECVAAFYLLASNKISDKRRQLSLVSPGSAATCDARHSSRFATSIILQPKRIVLVECTRRNTTAIVCASR